MSGYVRNAMSGYVRNAMSGYVVIFRIRVPDLHLDPHPWENNAKKSHHSTFK